MRPVQNKGVFSRVGIFLFFAQIVFLHGCATPGAGEQEEISPVLSFEADTREVNVRTPAKQIGSAYHVKIKIKKGDFEWVIPVWVKPDEKVSYLDPAIMRLLGWPAREPFEVDEVSIGGAAVRISRFGTGNSDWYDSPEFSKSCCAGVLGQDVLRFFLITFVPKSPTHLEWKQLPDAPIPGDEPAFFQSQQELKGLFSLESAKYKTYDLSRVSYVLDPRAKQVIFKP
jgi:hypothetical protein